MNAVKTEPADRTLLFNRILYSGFVLLSIYFVIRGNLGDAASNLGIALIFDPFAPLQWPQRKGWQKAWLLVHVVLVMALFAGWLFLKA